ncbi:hypothetical protein CDD81_2855 [Ophiocordyceps australis]|uniref:Uncharacterized protein n=1 Tax=Ophiocordyceps australis TaxID=1399860 RepID=A0A2C5XSX5_9HYPO|nr:hypothetical protein CDD81_2855 [Ophiocordyceps australis]
MSDIKQTGRKKRVHHLDTPFSVISWPDISVHHQDSILELLCNLLGPLGQYREAYIKSSKGKRAAKKQAQLAKPTPSESALVPPKPELDAKVDVGFNSITRTLQEMAQPRTQVETERKIYTMIFVARGNQSPAFNCHFPKMIAAASKHLPAEQEIRLVGFSKPCSERLSSCLGVPRVSSVAVTRDAPGAEALWTFVREVVAPINSSWLQDIRSSDFQGTKIGFSETVVGSKRARTK